MRRATGGAAPLGSGHREDPRAPHLHETRHPLPRRARRPRRHPHQPPGRADGRAFRSRRARRRRVCGPSVSLVSLSPLFVQQTPISRLPRKRIAPRRPFSSPKSLVFATKRGLSRLVPTAPVYLLEFVAQKRGIRAQIPQSCSSRRSAMAYRVPKATATPDAPARSRARARAAAGSGATSASMPASRAQAARSSAGRARGLEGA